MNKLIPALLLSLAFPAFAANTVTFKIKGMHCGACSASIQETVCKPLEGQTTTCKASLGKTKKEKADEMGELVVTMADNKEVNVEQITKTLHDNTDYKVISTSLKK